MHEFFLTDFIHSSTVFVLNVGNLSKFRAQNSKGIDTKYSIKYISVKKGQEGTLLFLELMNLRLFSRPHIRQVLETTIVIGTRARLAIETVTVTQGW
jgi:hypothetical protein